MANTLRTVTFKVPAQLTSYRHEKLMKHKHKPFFPVKSVVLKVLYTGSNVIIDKQPVATSNPYPLLLASPSLHTCPDTPKDRSCAELGACCAIHCPPFWETGEDTPIGFSLSVGGRLGCIYLPATIAASALSADSQVLEGTRWCSFS